MESTISTQLKAQFLRLYQIALADDNFSPLEAEMLYNWAEERGIDKGELDEILLSSTGQLEIPKTIEDKIRYLYDFAVMSWADGEISEDERDAMEKFALKFGFEEENVSDLTAYLLDSVKRGVKLSDLLNELN